MTTASTQLMTAEEFWEFVHRPENEGRFLDLIRGRIEEMSRPNLRYGVVCSNISGFLWLHARKIWKGYVCSNDTGVILERNPDTVRGPDVAYFEGVRRYADLPAAWSETLPRLAVEVLSPDDRPAAVTRRVTDYLRQGVPLIQKIAP